MGEIRYLEKKCILYDKKQEGYVSSSSTAVTCSDLSGARMFNYHNLPKHISLQNYNITFLNSEEGNKLIEDEINSLEDKLNFEEGTNERKILSEMIQSIKNFENTSIRKIEERERKILERLQGLSEHLPDI